MLNFDPRSMLAPGGVINGAGNAIAALAGVPARYKQVQEENRKNNLATQALQLKGAAERDDMDQKRQMNAANIKHLGALDANMGNGTLTFEQRKQLAEIRSGGGVHPKGWDMKLDPISGKAFRQNKDTGALEFLDTDKPGAVWQTTGNPAMQSLVGPPMPMGGGGGGAPDHTQPGSIPMVGRGGASPLGDRATKLSRLQQLMSSDNESDDAEIERLSAELQGQ